jgi:hypothetical protein
VGVPENPVVDNGKRRRSRRRHTSHRPSADDDGDSHRQGGETGLGAPHYYWRTVSVGSVGSGSVGNDVGIDGNDVGIVGNDVGMVNVVVPVDVGLANLMATKATKLVKVAGELRSWAAIMQSAASDLDVPQVPVEIFPVATVTVVAGSFPVADTATGAVAVNGSQPVMLVGSSGTG